MRGGWPEAPRRGGVLFKLLWLLVMGAAVLALAWMVLLPGVATRALSRRTGFTVSVRSLMANPFTGELRVRGLEVRNPPGFSRPDCLDVRELTVDADVRSLFSNHPMFRRVTLDVARMTVVTRDGGRTNWDLLREKLAAAGRGRRQTARVRQLAVQFDQLAAAGPGGGAMRETTLNLRQTFTDPGAGGAAALPEPLEQVLALGGPLLDLCPGAGE